MNNYGVDSRARRLSEALDAVKARHERAEIACSVVWPDGSRFDELADKVFHPASTVKAALLLTALTMLDQCEISLEHEVRVHNDFASWVKGRRFSVDPDGDSDADIHGFSQPLTVRVLLGRMIRTSGNLSTNLLLEVVGAETVASCLATYGITSVKFKRGMDDMPAFEVGCLNEATTTGLVALARVLHQGQGLSTDSAQLARELMESTEQRWGLGDLVLPSGRVGRKSGWITHHRHDFGWVETSRGTTYMAFLTRGIDDAQAPEELTLLARAAVHAGA